MAMMSVFFASLLIVGVSPAAAATRDAAQKQGFLSMRDGMRPEVVAMSLGRVEDEWKKQYRLYVECNQTAVSETEARRCLDAPRAFEHSCGKIVTAMVQASGGNRENVHEYMADVCSEPQLKGWRQGRCEILAATVLSSMTQDDYNNRESLNTQPMCVNFWSRFTAEEEQILKAERVEAEAQQKRVQEEREEEEKRMAEQADKQAKLLADEEAKEAKARDDERKKEEAEKAEAQAAAENLAEKQHQEELAAKSTAEAATAANSSDGARTTNEAVQSDSATAINSTEAKEAANSSDGARTTNEAVQSDSATATNTTEAKESTLAQNTTQTAAAEHNATGSAAAAGGAAAAVTTPVSSNASVPNATAGNKTSK